MLVQHSPGYTASNAAEFANPQLKNGSAIRKELKLVGVQRHDRAARVWNAPPTVREPGASAWNASGEGGWPASRGPLYAAGPRCIFRLTNEKS